MIKIFSQKCKKIRWQFQKVKKMNDEKYVITNKKNIEIITENDVIFRFKVQIS
jgi:hypothetical protein